MSLQNEKQTFDAEGITCQIISNSFMLPQKPLVSVIMITFNHELYIAQAIEGVLLQKTVFPIELIIGEDCSTDRTREIVLEYQKKYPGIIEVIISEENVGMHKNNMRTVQACRGKYIAFCEGDDYWHHPKKLQLQVDYLENHPMCGLVHGDVDRYDVETGKRTPNFHRYRKISVRSEKILTEMIINRYIVETCTAVIRKKMFDEIQKSSLYEFSEKFLMLDVQTWMEIAYRSEVKFMNESLATKRSLPESASRSKDINKNIKFIKSARDIALHYASKYGGKESKELMKNIVRHFNKALVLCAYHSGRPGLAKQSLEMARSYQTFLGPMSYLYFIGSYNNVTFYFIEPIRMWVKICVKIVQVAKTFTRHPR